MHEIIVKAYAKVNFGLKVYPKREDGYHAIEGIFQTINLYDELIVREISQTPECIVNCTDMLLPKDNTITNAYKAFFDLFKGKIQIPGISVELKKGIPSGGGLGGGSSDAAALIRAMEKICNVSLNHEQKDFIGNRTGSDVFFFLHSEADGTSCALVQGRGETVKRIKGKTGIPVILIFPESSSSTKEAYALLDNSFENGNSVKCPDFSELEFIYNKSVQDWTFKNSFTPVISNYISEIGYALSDIKNEDCSYSEMSGSGSTVFGIFTSMQEAENAYKHLCKKWNCKLVEVI